MKVYAVKFNAKNFGNCPIYEEEIKLFSTKERAQQFIKNAIYEDYTPTSDCYKEWAWKEAGEGEIIEMEVE